MYKHLLLSLCDYVLGKGGTLSLGVLLRHTSRFCKNWQASSRFFWDLVQPTPLMTLLECILWRPLIYEAVVVAGSRRVGMDQFTLGNCIL